MAGGVQVNWVGNSGLFGVGEMFLGESAQRSSQAAKRKVSGVGVVGFIG